jgi:ubiquitin C-terminal hydrolase
MSDYVIGPKDPSAPPIYDLYAVSLHSGGMGGGHYTAICQNPTNNK